MKRRPCGLEARAEVPRLCLAPRRVSRCFDSLCRPPHTCHCHFPRGASRLACLFLAWLGLAWLSVVLGPWPALRVFVPTQNLRQLSFNPPPRAPSAHSPASPGARGDSLGASLASDSAYNALTLHAPARQRASTLDDLHASRSDPVHPQLTKIKA